MCSCSCWWSVSFSLWRCFGGLTGSRFGLPTQAAGLSAARSPVCSSHARPTIAPPVVSPPWHRRVWSQRLRKSRPWREVKSRRGAPKRVNTEGFACPNRQCTYYRITEAHMHALVGDGKHGQAERIQTLRCQACRTTFSARRDTPMYRLKPPSRAGSLWCGSRVGRRTGCLRCRTDLRLPPSHHHDVADSRGLACSEVA
jgi:hypothetical protein